VRIFRNTGFTRFAGKEGITDGELREMVNQLEAGQADANLGGGVYKLRVARPGEGKSGGYRVIVFFKSEERTFYMHGFAKSDKANISSKELARLKKQAASMLSMSDAQLTTVLRDGIIAEI